MSISQMRAALCRLYGGAPKWVDRVRKMSDNQVYAIYICACWKPAGFLKSDCISF